jgi:hypothetical protein
MAKKSTKIEQIPELTRGTKKIIADAIKKSPDLNRGTLRNIICEDLFDKFPGDSLEYQLKRMNLETTKQVEAAIDSFIFKSVKSKNIVTEEEKSDNLE